MFRIADNYANVVLRQFIQKRDRNRHAHGIYEDDSDIFDRDRSFFSIFLRKTQLFHAQGKISLGLKEQGPFQHKHTFLRILVDWK